MQVLPAAVWLCVAVVLGMAPLSAAHGYTARVHQELTFIAAKQLGRCLAGSPVAPLSGRPMRNAGCSTR